MINQGNVRPLLLGIISILLVIQTFIIPIGTESVFAAERSPIEKKHTIDGSKRVVIVSASGDVHRAVQVVEERISSASIRNIYENVYGGFSLEIAEKDIDRLTQLSVIARVDDVAHYQPSLEGSIPFIGAGKDLIDMRDGKERHLTGKGVKVGIIDTGVDYKHPDLQRNYQGGYDIVDQDQDPMETKKSQGEPTLHGTHVAGIIAANGRITGVAPEADIYAYRALGPGGQGTTEHILEAIERAVEDEVDVLNLSLGNTVNGPDWPTSLALDRVVEKGVVAVTSNGNSGPNMWSVGSPGTSTKAISVGASLPPIEVPSIQVKGLDEELSLVPILGAKSWKLKESLDLVDVGHGLLSDYSGKDVKDKLVLIKRGRSNFAEKLALASKAGAKAALIYNNLDGTFAGAVTEPIPITGATVSKEEGEALVSLLKNKKNKVKVETHYDIKQDLMAPFSSRGPVTETWAIKPDIVAPGVAIQSTVPKGYLDLNGTSMASPHVAGAAALLLEQHPEWSPEQVKAALMNTTKRLQDEQGNDYLPFEQGTGRLQVDEAVNTESLISPATLSFGAMKKGNSTLTRELVIDIENLSDHAKDYTIDPPIGELDGVTWEMVEGVKVEAQSTQAVTLKATIDTNLLQSGLHTGLINVNENENAITIPYMLFMEEPNYPRVMAFQMAHSDKENGYYYEYYLPGGAEESSVHLYDPDTFEYIATIVENQNQKRGMVSGEIDDLNVEPGRYLAFIHAVNEGKSDTIEAIVDVGEEWVGP
ncbi:S8 family serine peptidase [Bacillus sp. Marseille-P3800]|uniref:S8 family serine peptidase n=1 Tax=Bacillus sp. Marseille-P3800 TaxID=2014782 RepID=UPI000C06990E|nr:S8 family serine peptidase [Bacillus sp. Marseille-P3800]